VPDTTWTRVFGGAKNPRLRLFCLPPAGAGSAWFHSWGSLHDEVEIRAIVLPGRERRLRDAPLSRLEDAAERLADDMKPLLDRPFACAGHSLGALGAFEVVRSLRRRALALPALLIVSASRAPQLPNPEAPVHRLPAPAFIDALRAAQVVPPALLQEPDLLMLLLPALRADFEMSATYAYNAEPPLDLPIVALGGLSDETVSPAELRAWSAQTTSDFRVQWFPGGHDFLDASNPVVGEFLRQELDRAVTGAR
jgi:medium-chain acyl-[acyl-carrier-protein] hydrolase